LPDDAPRAGDRFPWVKLKLSDAGPVEDLFAALDDTRFNLLVIGQPAAANEVRGLSPLVRAHIIPNDPDNDSALARVRLTGPAFYLLRPDGHVGLAGLRFDAAVVTRYLADVHIHPGTVIPRDKELRLSA
jgi:hypothetical protein